MAELQPLVKSPNDQTECTPGPLQHQLLSESIPHGDSTKEGRGTSTIDVNSTPPPPPPYRRGKFVQPASGFFPWIPEAVSYVISLVSLAAIIIIVRSRHHKQLPDWPSFLTINFLVSIFSSTLKAGLLMPVAEALSELKWLWFSTPRLVNDMEEFDLASRGPRGSLRFLFRLPRNKLACIGACITVASLGIDALTQLSVQTYDCLGHSPDPASLFQTNNYTIAEPGTSGAIWVIDVPMSLAIYQGILASGAELAEKVYDCPSGNCTFPDPNFYRSLAMCSSVVNISDSIKELTNDNALPSGVNTTYHGAHFSTAEALPSTDNPEEIPLFAFEALSDAGPFAFRVEIFPCVQTFQKLSISKSKFTQELVSETKLPRINMTMAYYSLAGNLPSVPGIDCAPARNAQGLKTAPVRTLKGGREYVIPVESATSFLDPEHKDLAFAKSPDLSWYDPRCTYTFGVPPTQAVPEYFRLLFGTPGKSKSVTGTYGGGIGDILLIYLWREYTVDMAWAETYIRSLTNAMTIHMRKNGDNSNSIEIKGQALGNTTCIRFEWRFLLLDIFLIVLTGSFVSITAWMSSRNARSSKMDKGRGPWKSSSLPVLWCGLEDITRQRFGRTDHVKTQMKGKSEGLKVKLTRIFDPEELQSLHRDVHIAGSAAEHAELNYFKQLEPGHAPEAGRWVLRAEREVLARTKPNMLRRFGLWLSDYLPI